MLKRLSPDDPRLTWQGAVSLQRTDEWVMPWRIPYDERTLFPDTLLPRAAMPSGVRFALRSDTTVVAGNIVATPEPRRLDLCCDGTLIQTLDLDGRDRFQFAGLPEGNKLIEVWLPPQGEFRLRSLGVSEGATVLPFDDARPRWITYGSSITHCTRSESPTQTWPAIVAQERGLNLTSLGFGGECHLDVMIAQMIRYMPVDFFSMCVGINIYGAASLSVRSFRPAIIGFVQTVREKHPDTPFVIMSTIYAPPCETTPNAVGFTLQAMREEVAAAVNTLQAYGDRNIHYVNGLEILGPGLVQYLLDDGVHPSAEGDKVIGRRFLDRVVSEVFPPTPRITL